MVERAREHLDAVAVQRAHVHVLDLAVCDVGARAAPVAGGLAQAQERRGVVTGADVTRRVDEGPDQQDRMAPRLNPVRTQPLQCSTHHRGRGVLATTSGQDAEPLVRRDEAKPARLVLSRPANELVTGSTRKRR